MTYPTTIPDLDADLIPGSGVNPDVPLGQDGASAYTHPAHHAAMAAGIEAVQTRVGTGISVPNEGLLLVGVPGGDTEWADSLTAESGGVGVPGNSYTVAGGSGDQGGFDGARIRIGGAAIDAAGKVRIRTGDTEGTAGQVLTAQGDGFALWQSGIQRTTVTLSSADILDLHNTPVTLVAAPGAGKVAVPTHAVLSYTAGTTYNETGSSPTWGYTSGSYSGLGTLGSSISNNITGTEVRHVSGQVAAFANEPVRITVIGALTDGDYPVTITVWYTIEDVP